MATPDPERTLFSAESYFQTQPPPSTLENDIAGVRSFVHRQRDLGNKVVLVTVSVRPRPHPPPAVGSNLSAPLRAVGPPSLWSSTCEQHFCAPKDPVDRLELIYLPPLFPRLRRLECGFWTTSAPVSCSPRASIISEVSLNDRPSVRSRYSRCDVCRILSQGRLRRHLHAQTVQPSALQPPLLSFDEPVPRLSRYRKRSGQASRSTQDHRDAVEERRSAGGADGVQIGSTGWLASYAHVRHRQRLPLAAACRQSGAIDPRSKRLVLPCRCGKRLLLTEAEDGASPFPTASTNYGAYGVSQSEHKIQSGKGSLLIEMDQVPKILKPLVDEWTRDGFIVSFKVQYISYVCLITC